MLSVQHTWNTLDHVWQSHVLFSVRVKKNDGQQIAIYSMYAVQKYKILICEIYLFIVILPG